MTERPPASHGLDARTEALLRRLLRREAEGAIKKMLSRYHPEDIAAAMQHLTWQEQRRLYRAIEDKEMQAAILAALEDVAKREVTRDMSQEAVADLVERLEADDATDVVSVLPDALRAGVLHELEDEGTGDSVKSLLAWPAESAGGIMNTAVFTPITSPALFSNGPPEFPGFSDASVCNNLRSLSMRLMMPVVNVPAKRPKGLPIAITASPMRSLSLSPRSSGMVLIVSLILSRVGTGE